ILQVPEFDVREYILQTSEGGRVRSDLEEVPEVRDSGAVAGELPVEDLAGEPLLVAEPLGIDPRQPLAERAEDLGILLSLRVRIVRKLADVEPPRDPHARLVIELQCVIIREDGGERLRGARRRLCRGRGAEERQGEDQKDEDLFQAVTPFAIRLSVYVNAIRYSA